VTISSRRFDLWTGAAVAGALAIEGFIAGECLAVVLAALLSHRLFCAGMAAGAPWDGWRAAVRCMEVGLAGLLSSVGMGAMGASALAGWWAPQHSSGALLWTAVLVSGAVLTYLPSDIQSRLREALVWAGIAAALWLVMWRQQAGDEVAACLLLLGSSVAWGIWSWRLLGTTAGELFRAGQRLP
jgi:hypothetical protein